ncbi:MAG: protein-glutamate O-methyltransferase CheR [Gammaproteobacteria bacterium]|nr:protein-glutamate O-methyltransferase CheR [Gammaproteobacteria bacterium]
MRAAVAADAITIQDYQAFRSFLEDASGIVLGDNKQYLVTSRLTRIMEEHELDTFSTLMKRIQRDSTLRRRIMDAMTTNETSWFRDVYPFDILKEKLLPELAPSRPRQIRIWSAASSTGQEAYSLSMMTQEYLARNPGSLSSDCVQIFGTDISPSVLACARAASYEGVAVSRGLSPERRSRFFKQKGESWEIVDEIKKRVSFRELNLMKSYAALGKFDIIYCRNVLIYFSTELKRDILSRVAKALKPEGYLVLGGSESITNYSSEFDLVRWRNGVIYQLKP